MKCIICRETKEEFSDEHVIPDSIGGYYHIYNVCKDCNSKLGENVDTKLINHKFIQFQRNLLNLKGKKGSIPNPFDGVHTLSDKPEQKIIIEYKDGKFIPRLLPNIKTENIIENGFTLEIDKRDRDKAQQIIDKVLSRNGIPKDKVKTLKWVENELLPKIQIQQSIDIKEFKIGLLKIAYEFAIDSIDEYYNDPISIIIADLLHTSNFNQLNNIKFLGTGLDNEILKPFNQFFDFENVNKHYLILISLHGIGLVCFVNLFSSISIGILLSENSTYFNNDFIIGINDLKLKSFAKKRAYDALASIYTPINYRFQYFFKTSDELNRFLWNQNLPNFSFYRNEDKVPLFDINGNVKYRDLEEKITQEHLIKIPKEKNINEEVITQIIIDNEELYIKVLPSCQLCQIISVNIENYKIGKI